MVRLVMCYVAQTRAREDASYRTLWEDNVTIEDESKACADVPPPTPENGSVALNMLHAGERGVVTAMDGGQALLCRMTSLGFTPGAEVTVVQNYGRGPLIALVRDARIALGRGEAQKIYVHKRSG